MTSDGDRLVGVNWQLVAGASLISTGMAAYEITPASVTPTIRGALGIDPAQAGLIVGVMFGAGFLTSIPVGAMLDRSDSRHAMALSVLALVAVGAWGWLAAVDGDFTSLIASRVVGGIAYVVVWNAGIDLVGSAADHSNRGTAIGVFSASAPTGFAVGLGGGPIIANAFGWPVLFVAFTLVGLVGLAVFWPASHGLGRTQGAAPTMRDLSSVLRDRNVLLVVILAFFGYSLYLFVNSWGSSYLTDEIGLSIGLSGLLVAVFPAIGIAARVTSGVLSDRVFGGRRRPVILGAYVLAVPIMLVFTQGGTVPVLIGLLLVAGFAVQLVLGLSFTFVREMVEPRVAATAVAFQTSVGLAGGFVAPIAGGAIVDAAGYGVAFTIAGVLAAAGVAVAWLVPEGAGS